MGDVCNWEAKDGTQRGRGVSECAKRVRERPECGEYLSYSVGMCRCNPSSGIHANCTTRVADRASDIFRLDPSGGAQLIHSSQRCVYNNVVDADYFYELKPATSWNLW